MFEELVFTWKTPTRLGSRRVGQKWGVRLYDRLIARWPDRCQIVQSPTMRSLSLGDVLAIARVN